MTYEQEFQDFVHALCIYGEEDETFFHYFWTELLENEDVAQELFYYYEHRDFLAKTAVRGYTVIDIMVWQIDHFKAHMDRGEYSKQSNPERMVLMAFDTLLKMKKSPDSYVLALQTETGTDYAEKY